MPIDTSIYQLSSPKPVQVESPSMLDSLTKAMTLGDLSLKNKQARLADADQTAVKEAYAKNTGTDGTLNRAGFISQLSQSAPHLVQSQQAQFAQSDAAQADAKKKVLQDNLDKFSAANRLASTAVDQASYDQMKQEMQSQGLPTDHLPPQYDPKFVNMLRTRSAMMTLDAKQGLDAIEKMSKVGIEEAKAPLDRAKTVAETNQTVTNTDIATKKAPLERAEISARTGKDVAETRKAYADTDKIKSETGGPAAQFKNLPVENQEQIKKIAEKNASKLGIMTQIQSTVGLLKDPNVNPDQKLLQARQMIKVLNSTEGQDAVGAEESKRLAGMLEYRFGNFTEPGKFIGRDIEGFTTQAELTAKGLGDAIKANTDQIEKLKGGRPLQVTTPSTESIVKNKGGMVDRAKQFASQARGALESTANADESTPNAPVSKPKVGEERRGYVYLGGPEWDQKSWKKAR
jgi:hypothetical protein